MRICCFFVTVVALLAQQPTTIRTTVPLVVAPVTVLDKQGRHVHGLSAEDFLLLDHGKRTRIDVEVSTTPVSVVFVIETNQNARAGVGKLQKVGSMVEPLLTGAGGEAAILTYNDKVNVIREFTRDPQEMTVSFRRLFTDGRKGKMLDGIQRAIDLLATRNTERRRIIICIGEAKDRGSEIKLPALLETAQVQNVTIYPLRYSQMLTAFTAKPGDDANGPYSPQSDGLIGIFRELGRLGSKDAMDALARYTGGSAYSFVKQNGLETVLEKVGEDIHSQYLISFQPEPSPEPVFRAIEVKLPNRPELSIQTRPGYWIR
jgi:VWFA-related protein